MLLFLDSVIWYMENPEDLPQNCLRKQINLIRLQDIKLIYKFSNVYIYQQQIILERNQGSKSIIHIS